MCADLARQLIGDAEGATKDIRIDVVNAASESDAVTVARAVSRSNLLKCAIHGEDPNWGRVISAAGTTDATFDPHVIAVAINDVWVCRDGQPGEARDLVDMSGARGRHHRRPVRRHGDRDDLDQRPDRHVRPRELGLLDMRTTLTRVSAISSWARPPSSPRRCRGCRSSTARPSWSSTAATP